MRVGDGGTVELEMVEALRSANGKAATGSPPHEDEAGHSATMVSPVQAEVLRTVQAEVLHPVPHTTDGNSNQQGPLLTRQVCRSSVSAIVSAAAGCAITVLYTRATTTRSACLDICPPDASVQPCTNYCFNNGWCSNSDLEKSGYSSDNEVECPPGYVNKWHLVMLAGAVIVLTALSAQQMSAFPGRCRCDPCFRATRLRVACFALGWVSFAGLISVGPVVGAAIWGGHISLDGLTVGVIAVWGPLVPYSLLTMARCISGTFEGESSPGSDGRRRCRSNTRGCLIIVAVVAIVAAAVPLLEAIAVVDSTAKSKSSSHDDWGFGGCGDMPILDPECTARVAVQHWTCYCSGSPSLDASAPLDLRTLRANVTAGPGSPPDSAIGTAILSWRSGRRDLQMQDWDLPLLYPWLNPGCRDVGSLSGYEFCLGTVAPPTLPLPTGLDVPKSCLSWTDGCNTCQWASDETHSAICTEMYCERSQLPYCLAFNDGSRCVNASALPTCEILPHLDYEDWWVKEGVFALVEEWAHSCPSPGSLSCSPRGAISVECLSYEQNYIVCGRPFVSRKARNTVGKESFRVLRARSVPATQGTDWAIDL
eukprot:SAG31_NODE_3451_length_4255_cov_5.771655_3_plen_593_part_00